MENEVVLLALTTGQVARIVAALISTEEFATAGDHEAISKAICKQMRTAGYSSFDYDQLKTLKKIADEVFKK